MVVSVGAPQVERKWHNYQLTNFIALLYVPYELSFRSIRGWSPGIGVLTLLPIALGSVLGMIISLHLTRRRYALVDGLCNRMSPEARLIPMIIGSWALPTALLVHGWTSSRQVVFVPELVAGIPLGIGE